MSDMTRKVRDEQFAGHDFEIWRLGERNRHRPPRFTAGIEVPSGDGKTRHSFYAPVSHSFVLERYLEELPPEQMQGLSVGSPQYFAVRRVGELRPLIFQVHLRVELRQSFEGHREYLGQLVAREERELDADAGGQA
jgi:hypothetical protein